MDGWLMSISLNGSVGRGDFERSFDFTIADASKSTQAVKQLEDVAKRYGYVVKVLDEYRNPSSRATGGHLHVSVLGFKGTAEAAKQAQDELSLVTQTNEEAKQIQEESQRAQQSVARQYLTEREKLEIEHADKLLEIQKAFAGDDSAIKKYTDLIAAFAAP
jgi:LAS superfamily LD-carboxypeptidase LdcB